MSEHIHLIGAEQIQNAGGNMRQAAEEMQRAASKISDTVTFHLPQQMEEWVSRIEAAAERIATALEATNAADRK